MAAMDIMRKLQAELTCSICLADFLDPATLDCGHNFCHGCLVGYWGDITSELTCPQCKEVLPRLVFTPNRQLANIVMLSRELGNEAVQGHRGGQFCEQHPPAVAAFCVDDLTPFCSACDGFLQEHSAHNVISVAEAAQKLKKRTGEAKEVMVSKFMELCHFLTKQKDMLLLEVVGRLEKEMTWKQAQYTAIIHRKASDLDAIIQDLKEKYHQPTPVLLQDVGSTLKKCNREIVMNPAAFPNDIKILAWDLLDFNAFLEKCSTQFKDTMISGYQMKKANVTFDPDTAHPRLILSEDRKSLRLGSQYQAVPEKEERFDKITCVLGCEAFLEGRHYWDILLGPKGCWGVGVARNSVKRKGLIPISALEGIWAIAKCADRWVFLDPPNYFYIPVGWEVKKIRVSVNYIGQRVTFCDSDRGILIHTYPRASFSSEPLRPIFWLQRKGQLSIVP
ncbi:Zinc finger protein RFP [Varanus komodoensis]|uniref:zinc finger protein RFP-like n=1 Tax=Varanus komodoensis TaxID=61221 RepID=UPI001CF7E50A|nr:zinc finger protein RFP-like [Varanus komodoensis]KAF7234958.1 Zinc finger protein RFP [Varanus komodoensis]